jgi:hypothetical protein
MSDHRRILDHFHRRLLAAVTRSSLLKATVSKTGRLLDVSRLELVKEGLGNRVLRGVIESGRPISLELRLRVSHGGAIEEPVESEDQYAISGEATPPGNLESGGERQRGAELSEDRLVLEHRSIYDALDRRMRRYAELVKRETGVHSLWLGYPLLYVVAGEGEAQQWILAPVFLWPVAIQLDSRQEGRVWIGRDRSAGPVKFNRAMAAWVQRQLGFELKGPDEDELEEFAWDEAKTQLASLAGQFRDPPQIQCEAALEPVPNAKLLNPEQSPRLFQSCVIGTFRWQNEAILADLETLKQLETIEGVASGFVSGERLAAPADAARPPEADRYQVCDADFSQERVIWQSRLEPGLVVHGPPGTGKSQTIVNVIADALAHGRTILMVCQKYAATRVVFERLKGAGLDGLCVEITDAEKSRLPVFTAIRDQIDALTGSAAPAPNARREQLAREITRLEEELDTYARALFERDERIGLAYRQLKATEGTLFAKFPTLRPLVALQHIATQINGDQLEDLTSQVNESGWLFRQAGVLTNPWRFREPMLAITEALPLDVGAMVARLREMDAQHSAHIAQHGAGTQIDGEPAEFQGAAAHILPKLRELAKQPESVRARLLRGWIVQCRGTKSEDWQRCRAKCEAAIAAAKRVSETPLDPVWDERVRGLTDLRFKAICQDARNVLAHAGKWWRFLNLSFRRGRKTMRAYAETPDDTGLREASQRVLDYAAARELRQQLAAINHALVGSLRPQADKSSQVQFPATAFEELKWAEWMSQYEARYTWLRGLIDAIAKNALQMEAERLTRALDQAAQRQPFVESLLRGLRELTPYLTDQAFVEPDSFVRGGQSIDPWLDALEWGLKRLQSLMAWDLARPTRSEPLASILGALEEYESQRLRDERVPAPPAVLAEESYGEWWAGLAKYSVVLAWQGALHRKWPILVAITPETHAAKVSELERLIAEKRQLESSAIHAHWLAKQLPHRTAPWKRMFQLRRSKYGEAKRLREAISLSLPEGLLAMRPCWLVNPGTAAEIFPLAQGLFDLVIFDEASQCPVEQAVPAIYRGKSVIVSGDEKQLPPTSFFASGWAADEVDDDGEEEATDKVVTRDEQFQRVGVDFLLHVEDLLGAGIGNLPERYLSVHYRSLYPELIEFSNRAFYNGRLEAPPARVSSINGRRPIRYQELNGLYERRTNADEARSVVAVLKEMWLGGNGSPTIGVVTFNQPQRDLIENMLEDECLRDKAFDARYQQELSRQDENQDVGFFVKNLENVQGDERDVMIFSTTFGRDGNQRFYRRFGPVGAMGGERRLNVAVTRAKQQVIVVGSMPILEIASALSAELAPGSDLTPAAYLQLYLAYAKAVSEDDGNRIALVLERAGHKSPAMTVGDAESPFEEEVRELLEKLGYTVHSQVGDSGFRIDLAVAAHDPSRGYILGIECDGAAYHSDRSARLRDVWRAQILRRRGWRLHRIWSTRWWYHRGEEIESMKLALEQAQAHFDPTANGS